MKEYNMGTGVIYVLIVAVFVFFIVMLFRLTPTEKQSEPLKKTTHGVLVVGGPVILYGTTVEITKQKVVLEIQGRIFHLWRREVLSAPPKSVYGEISLPEDVVENHRIMQYLYGRGGMG